jgi:hypothetical protein
MRALWTLVSIIALVSSCTSTPYGPKQAEITQEVSVAAKVIAVDAATREVTLDREDGARIVIVAGPEVRNFDQIRAGDTVTARYMQSLSARVLAPGEAGAEPSMAIGAGRAEAGQRPAGGFGAGFTLTVTVESVDRQKHMVVFTDPADDPHVVRAQREEGKRFVDGLKLGDRVELVYAEAVAVSIE